MIMVQIAYKHREGSLCMFKLNADKIIIIIHASIKFRANFGPPAKRHSMAFCWWADFGPLSYTCRNDDGYEDIDSKNIYKQII